MTMKKQKNADNSSSTLPETPAESDGDELEEVKIAGGSIVDDKPCFSADSRFLFVINDGKVHAYNTATGELAHCLETKCPIVAVCPDAPNHRQITTCDSEATMVVWDFLLGTSLKKWSLSPLLSDGSSVVGLLRAAGATQPLLLLRRPGPEPTADLVRVSTDPARPQQVARQVRRGAAGRWELELGCEGRLLAALVKPDAILVRNLWQKDAVSKQLFNNLRVDSDRPFTCLSCHPTEPTVAAGDSSGRLLLWRRLLADQPPVRSILHWHTLPLPSISFSPEGTYLVSGGEECVLVYWHTRDEKPSFLPRLGMPIRHVTVSPDNQLVVTSHADNVLRLVTPQRQVSRLVRGLTWGAGGDPTTGLVLEPRSGALLLNGAVGHLQLFSPHERRDLFSLDVVQTNYLTRERTGSPATCDVTRVAVASDGGWMATLEERVDGRSAAERRLKFWAFDEPQQSYVLNTCVEDPHESTLTGLEFQPSSDAQVSPLAVTTGTDGAIKYWSLVDDSDIYGSKRCWSCDAVGSHRRLPAGCAAFSPDGCQLAVGFAAAVTLWAPDRNRLLHTLSNVTLRHDVRQVVFGRGRCCHLLVARADTGLRVWNLQTVTLAARIDLRITHLAADPASEYMAAFSATNKVFVFRPSSTRPVHQAALGRRVASACFVPHKRPRSDLPHWQRASQLFFITDQQALHTLDRPDCADIGSGPADVITGHVTPTPFSALLAEQRRSAVTPGQPRSQSEVTPGLQRVLEMLESPSHTLPPLTRICSPFLEGMLYLRDSDPAEGQAEEATTSAGDVTSPADGTSAVRRSGPSLQARLDHLLAADLAWLAV